MGYVLSVNSITNVQEYLDILLNSKENPIVLKSNDPRTLAYYLRQAQSVAKRLEYEPYNELDFKFKEAESTVICVRKTPIYASLVKAVVSEGVPHPEVRKIEEVVSTCIEHNCTMTFSNYHPSETDFLLLQEWGKESKYEFHISDGKLIAKYINE